MEVLTLYGKLPLIRWSLIPADAESKERLLEFNGLKSVHPLDSYLGIAGLPFKITPCCILRIAFWAQNQLSYQRAEEAIRQVLSIDVDRVTIRNVVNHVGDFVFKNDCKNALEAKKLLDTGRLNLPYDKKGTLYIETDGAAVNTRTKTADSTWRENKLAVAFTSDDIRWWTTSNGESRHSFMQKPIYCSLIGSASDFKSHVLALAVRAGYGRYMNTVFISDGATWIRNMIQEIFPDAQQILDFYHLCENVNKYARGLFGSSKSQEGARKKWANEICDYLKSSQYQKVLDELGEGNTVNVDGVSFNLHGYITNNINNIDYLEYQQKGFFIGSGIVESANKTVLQDRLKRAGMRWNVQCAQAMLTLRAKQESGLWESDVVYPFLNNCFTRSLNL